MRRPRLLALLACLLTALAIAPGATSSASNRSWAQPQIRVVVARGLMARSVASFRPNDALTQGELADLVAGLTEQPPKAVANPSAPVTLAQLDAKLVRTLEFADEATLFQDGAVAAGLRPPGRFGTEVVARLLGLRTNHPAGQDQLEVLPNDPVPRAEVAYSVAQILRLSEWQTTSVEDAAASFQLPAFTPWQRRVLTSATTLIGYPYVWGGEFERPDSPFGAQAQGGFDCSGFAWRVYKLQSYPGAPQLPTILRGRTAADMAGEVLRRQRIKPARLTPADLVFFGRGGPRAKPAQIDHMGLYLGNGWLLHSSRYGVALAQLDGWYEERLAWGRRPLAEAGL
ncbi:MAG TPA: C40 family peptidase [Gaiellaceae bacterium]|nr:C40 family peptidase [Gaiellaceae bacterium]